MIILELNISQKVLNKITDKSITQNTFRIQDNESIICGFYCIAFIEYIFDGKVFLDYTNLYIYINIYIYIYIFREYNETKEEMKNSEIFLKLTT